MLIIFTVIFNYILVKYFRSFRNYNFTEKIAYLGLPY